MSTRIKSTKKYRALIAAGLSESAAVKYLSGETPEPVVEDKPTPEQELAEAGFTKAEIAALLGLKDEAVTLSPRDAFEAQVKDSGFTFHRGRVYVNVPVLEAAVRVFQTGTPEIVSTSGVGHTKAVALFREDSGDVSIQNLGV